MLICMFHVSQAKNQARKRGSEDLLEGCPRRCLYAPRREENVDGHDKVFTGMHIIIMKLTGLLKRIC